MGANRIEVLGSARNLNSFYSMSANRKLILFLQVGGHHAMSQGDIGFTKENK